MWFGGWILIEPGKDLHHYLQVLNFYFNLELKKGVSDFWPLNTIVYKIYIGLKFLYFNLEF
jgi:hypothetical protein